MSGSNKSSRQGNQRPPAEPKNQGNYIGESKKQQDSLRKAAEAPPRPPKTTRGSDK